MNMCPACGFAALSEAPRAALSGGGSYEICPSCDFEFGVTDDDQGFSYSVWREKWIEGGMRWNSRSVVQPKRWDPVGQLLSLAGSAEQKAL